jgi:NAD(P)H-dependent FMN reductase
MRNPSLALFVPEYKHEIPAASKAVITFFYSISELYTAQPVSQQVLHEGCS